MKNHDLSLSSVGAVAMSLLSGVILIAPGTLSARENSDSNLDPQAGDNVRMDDSDAPENRQSPHRSKRHSTGGMSLH